MPTIPTYIKTSDLPKYLAIQTSAKGAWSEFIHNALNGEGWPSGLRHLTANEESASSAGSNPAPSAKLIKTPRLSPSHSVDKLDTDIQKKIRGAIKQPQDTLASTRLPDEWAGPIFKKGRKEKK